MHWAVRRGHRAGRRSLLIAKKRRAPRSMGDRGTTPTLGYCQLPPNALYNWTVVVSV